MSALLDSLGSVVDAAVGGEGAPLGATVTIRSAVLPDIPLRPLERGPSGEGPGLVSRLAAAVRPEIIAGPVDVAPYGKNETPGKWFPLVLVLLALLVAALVLGFVALARKVF